MKELGKELGQYFQTKVNIQVKPSGKGRIQIDLILDDDLQHHLEISIDEMCIERIRIVCAFHEGSNTCDSTTKMNYTISNWLLPFRSFQVEDRFTMEALKALRYLAGIGGHVYY